MLQFIAQPRHDNSIVSAGRRTISASITFFTRLPIPPFYDSLLAKLIVHAPTRP